MVELAAVVGAGVAGLLAVEVVLLGCLYVRLTYRESIVFGGILCLALVQITSDALSLLGRFSPAWIGAAWLALAALLAPPIWVRRRRLRRPTLALSRGEKVVYGAVLLICVLTFVTGFSVAPNNWDSLAYHLSRASHWLQDGSLAFFQTPDARENAMSPLADLVVAQFMAVGLGDTLAFTGQWIGGIVTLVGVSLVSDYVYSSRRVTALSVLAAATVPMLVSQMSTTQADLIAGVPLAGAALAWILLQRGRTRIGVVVLALSLSCAASIKLTSLLLILPVAAIVAWHLIRHRQWGMTGLLAAATAVLVIVMNVRFLIALEHNASAGQSVADGVFNSRFGLDIVFVNLLRDGLSQLQIPVAQVNEVLASLASKGAQALRLDLNLPEATFGQPFELTTTWSEDHAAAPWHVLLASVAAVMTITFRRPRLNRRAVGLVLMLATQLVLVASTLRWQVWGNRFTFLVIVFASPLVGWLLARWPPWSRYTVAAAMAAIAVAWCLLQPLRGLAGTEWLPRALPVASAIPLYQSPFAYERFDQLFMHHPPTAVTYRKAVDYALSLDPVILDIQRGEDGWEYPVWRRLREVSTSVLIAHGEGEPTTAERVVRVCLGECDTSNMTAVRTFVSGGPPSPSMKVGPSLTVGLVEPK